MSVESREREARWKGGKANGCFRAKNKASGISISPRE